MLKYTAVSWGNGVNLINWHTHLQRQEYYPGLRIEYNNKKPALDGCIDHPQDATMMEFKSEGDNKKYCAKTSWFVYRKSQRS